MELTKEEKDYCTAYSEFYKEYGDEVPQQKQWEFNDVRRALGISKERALELNDYCKQSEVKKKVSAATSYALTKWQKVTRDNILEMRPNLEKELLDNISAYEKNSKALNVAEKEKENNHCPTPISKPEPQGFITTIIMFAIAYGLFQWIPWLGVAMFVIEILILISNRRSKAKYKRYEEEHENFLSTKERLKKEIPRLKMEVEKIRYVLTEELYRVINNVLAIPIPHDAINEDSWKQMNGCLTKLLDLYGNVQMATDSAQKSAYGKKYFDAKLAFVYEFSLKAESNDVAYEPFKKQLLESQKTGNANILRVDDRENSILATKKYDFYTSLDNYKMVLNGRNINWAIDKLNTVKDINVDNSFGFTNMDKLSGKTEQMRTIYESVKTEYDKLLDLSDKINNILTYARTVAYRNVYLGVELLNYIRDNAGGSKLTAQKDGVGVSAVDGLNGMEVSIDMDVTANVKESLNSLAKELSNKDVRKFAVKNPKMAMGAAALMVVGNYLNERVEKINANNDLQEQIVKSVSQMVDGYNAGKAGMLRAIEITKALSNANIGFLAIYAPLRDKFFVEGCTSATMADLQSLAKATQEYKHISDTKL